MGFCLDSQVDPLVLEILLVPEVLVNPENRMISS